MKAKTTVIGILAHVDAGKTTLSENILYRTGVIRNMGRVDHGDTFFDTDSRERKRGITIFSKEAVFSVGERLFTLIDTPGHTDLSAETERALSILDVAVMIISATDGVQSHTRTLLRLLKRYELPFFIFVNKMDMEGADEGKLLSELKSEVSEGCVKCPFGDPEELAVCDEKLLESYIEHGGLSKEEIALSIAERKLIPVIFGSALRDKGVDELLSALSGYTILKELRDEFSAIVYKLTKDKRGDRLTHMKLTGGELKIKDEIVIGKKTVKAERIRRCQGDKLIELTEAGAGEVVAVAGLSGSFTGMTLGSEEERPKPLLVPLFEYAIVPPFDIDRKRFYLRIKELEEEIPELSLSYIPEKDEIHAHLMGAVQNEIIKDLIAERYGVNTELSEGSIIYKETIASGAEGVGHFEPLRHYAEVHLLIEPAERGSGIEAVDAMGEGKGLSENYRKLILSHIMEKEHKGVLTGAALTDVRISLVAGRSHEKHTEGGDFREAVYRAIRQGLMYSENILLEPYYEYRLTIPRSCLGRAINDIQRMKGSVETKALNDKEDILTGKAPASLMQNYARELSGYTKGEGRLELAFCGYDRCHNEEDVVGAAGYDPEADTDEPSGSVFCTHGAGFHVPWNEVYDYMHIGLVSEKRRTEDISSIAGPKEGLPAPCGGPRDTDKGQLKARDKKHDYLGHGYESDKELMRIFRNTFGLTKSERNAEKEDDEALLRRPGWQKKKKRDSWRGDEASGSIDIADRKRRYLLVDGYNIIFAWDELSELARLDLGSARLLLMDILSNYQGYKGIDLILVFDAYRVKGGKRSTERYDGIYVVYTEEAETADRFIERTVHDMDKKHDVTVATSDSLEQMIVFGEGAVRLSARGLYEEVMKASEDMHERFLKQRTKLWNTVIKEEGGE